MHIEILAGRHTESRDCVAFEVVVDGETAWCSVSYHALVIHFDAQDCSQEEMLVAFDNGRLRIDDAVCYALELNGGAPVDLTATDFG
ncbi:DUF1488 family protein [Paraburkholderia sp. RL17-373-BIF-A]|uniref:DUF1488 family protein n=1 Tax=Paraburkholderia sp. RL17-373-BIF-A TaxID=3031629 RepID=UPI0038B9A55E